MSTGLSKYYKLFGLSESATQAEIKRKYRQLAMLYHPDKHGGDERKFIEIKTAYEYLTGQKSVSQPQQADTFSPTRSTSKARQQSEAERIKQAKQRIKDNEYKEHIENERYFQSLTSGKRWKILRFSAMLCVIVVAVLTAELFLPNRLEKTRITAYGYSISYENQEVSFGSLSSLKKIIVSSGKSYYIENSPSVYLSDPDIIVVKSAVFHNETSVIPMYDSEINPVKIHYNIGAHIYLILPLFLFPVGVVLFRRKTYTFTLFYFLSLYLSTPLLAYYLFSNDRWLHLLTFGFL